MITKHILLSWLQAHPAATIATLSEAGAPELAVVYTHVDEDFRCHFISKESTRKYKNISSNRTATLSWFDETTLTTCEIAGEAYVVDDNKEAALMVTHMQELVINKKTQYWTPPMGQLEGGQYVVFRVEPRAVHYVDYTEASTQNPEPERLEFLM